MARQPAIFKQADLARAVKGVKAAGLQVARVEVCPDGRFIVFPGIPEKVSAPAENEWDSVK